MLVEYPPVSIVIPNYNGKALLGKNLPAVCQAAHQYPGSAEIVVVDDGSSEQGAKEVVLGFEGVCYVQHEQNQGFSAAVWTGINSATSELVFLLNSDVSPADSSIAPLVGAVQEDNVFSASPLIYNEDGSPNSYSLNQYVWKGLKLVRKSYSAEQLAGQARPVKHLFCSGGSVMLRKSVFLSLGGFSDLYKPYYSEDLDLGARAWRRGWHSVFEPQSSVIHQEVGSIISEEKAEYVKMIQRRNSFFFEWSHFSLYRLLCFRSVFWLRQLVGRLIKRDKTYLKGFWLAIKHVGAARVHRTVIAADAPKYSFDDVIAIINKD